MREKIITLFLVYNRRQAKKAYKIIKNKKNKHFVIFPLETNSYLYLKNKNYNLSQINKFFPKNKKDSF
jgi:hypothetical protein